MSLPELDNLVRIGQLNLAEYEGYLEVEESTVAEMCELVQSLIADVQKLLD
jgi:hypothetical protein